MKARAYLLGVALLVAHALALPALLSKTAASALAIVPSPGRVLPPPPSSRARLTVDGRPAPVDGLGDLRPGLRHLEWTESYRGGFSRSVGFTVLRGARQPVGQPVCGLDLFIGSQLLGDRGRGPSPAGLIRRQVEDALQGFEQWPVGEFRTARVELRLAMTGDLDRYLLRAKIARDHGSEPQPYLRAEVEVELSEATVPVVIAVVPRIESGAVVGRSYVQARVEADGFLTQTLIDLFDGNETATAEVKDQLEDMLEELVARPPALRIGHTDVPVLLCPGAELELVGEYLRVPLATAGPATTDLVAFAVPTDEPRLEGDIALAVDLPAANALLHQLWATREVESAMAAELPNLALSEILTLGVRIAELPMPPTIEVAGGRLAIAAAVAIAITDDGETSPAQLFVRAATELSDGQRLAWTTTLDYLDVSCRDGERLMSCYDTIEDLAPELAPPVHTAVGEQLAAAIQEGLEDRPLVTGLRLGLDSLDAAVQLEPQTGQIVLNGWFRLVE